MTDRTFDGFGDGAGFDDLDDFFARPRPTRRVPAPAPASATVRVLRPPGGVARPPASSRGPRGPRGPRPPRPARSRRRPGPVAPDQARRRTVVRLAGFVIVVLLACAGIAVRLADVQLAGGACRTESVADCRAYGAGQRQAERTIPAVRGTIYDRSGQPFALSVPAHRVVVDPTLVEDPAAAASALGALLDADEADLLEALADTDTRWRLLASAVPDDVRDDIAALGLDGVSFEATNARANPSDLLARSVIGRTYPSGDPDDKGRIGASGIERSQDAVLEGTPGTLRYEQDPSGGRIADTAEKLEPAVPGTDLYLTLDQSLQYAAEQAVTEQVEATGAKQGMAIITRPSTGEVLAMVSVATDEEGTVANTTDNRPVRAAFEPGSVNKMITVAGAMEEGLIDPETTREVPDNLLVGDHTFTDHDPHPTEQWSTTDILVTSSNVGTIKIAEQLGDAGLDRYLRAFGFGEVTGPDFPGEFGGIMQPVEDWSTTDMGSIPIGQGIGVTALQMLAAYNVIANDGVYVEPKLVRATDEGEGQRATAPSARRRVVSAETAQGMSGMLQKVVSEGTGAPAQVPGYPVAGKTGTARIPQDGADPEDGYKDEDGRYHYESGFVGFVAGADLSIIVTIQDAQTSIYGSEVAAPVFARLAATALLSEQVPPPALADAASVPELSASAKEIQGEDPGLVTETTQG